MTKATFSVCAIIWLPVPAEFSSCWSWCKIECTETAHVLIWCSGWIRTVTGFISMCNGHLLSVSTITDGDMNRTTRIQSVVVYPVRPLVGMYLLAIGIWNSLAHEICYEENDKCIQVSYCCSRQSIASGNHTRLKKVVKIKILLSKREVLLGKIDRLEPGLLTYMAIKDYVNTILIKQIFHCCPHTFCFSIMRLVGAVPRRVPGSHQPWGHFSVNLGKIFLQPLVLMRWRDSEN